MESNSPKVSVVVPVYKAEAYLRACVDSILGQTFADFELLLVDDGSPDGSGAICDEYAARDGRVRVFHKANGGVSSARQCGLDAARGDWISFVDADDYLPNTALGDLLGHTEGVDIVQGRCVRDDGRAFFDAGRDGTASNKEWIRLMIAGKVLSGPVAKLIRRTALRPGILSEIPREIVYGEDLLGNIRIAASCKAVAFISSPVYVYRNNNSSVSHRFVYTLPYGEKFFRLAYDELGRLGLTFEDKSVKAFYLNVLKHVLASGGKLRGHEFVSSWLPRIKYGDVCMKDFVWLVILRSPVLSRLYQSLSGRSTKL